MKRLLTIALVCAFLGGFCIGFTGGLVLHHYVTDLLHTEIFP